MIFFSPSTNGFYDEAIHGARLVRLPDPSWVRPLISVTLQPGEQYFDGTQIVANPGPDLLALSNVPDWSAEHPNIEQPNPDTKIPGDAVEISAEEHAVLMDGQGAGSRIVAGEGGRPVLQEPQPPTQAELIAHALARIDGDTDRIYNETVGARVEEYRRAEADALAFKAAGYAGPVPPFVADHLAARGGWTAQEAADDILATAAAWRGAQAQIRANRLQCKELARKAAHPAGVEAALQQWAEFVAAIRTALGLSIP